MILKRKFGIGNCPTENKRIRNDSARVNRINKSFLVLKKILIAERFQTCGFEVGRMCLGNWFLNIFEDKRVQNGL